MGIRVCTIFTFSKPNFAATVVRTVVSWLYPAYEAGRVKYQQRAALREIRCACEGRTESKVSGWLIQGAAVEVFDRIITESIR